MLGNIRFYLVCGACRYAAYTSNEENEVEKLNRQFISIYDKQYDQAEDFAKHGVQSMEAKQGLSHFDVARVLHNRTLVYLWSVVQITWVLFAILVPSVDQHLTVYSIIDKIRYQ